MKEKHNFIPHQCPDCGGEVSRILYGEPMCSEDDYERLYGERVIFGGCLIMDDNPTYKCRQCGRKFCL